MVHKGLGSSWVNTWKEAKEFSAFTCMVSVPGHVFRLGENRGKGREAEEMQSVKSPHTGASAVQGRKNQRWSL